MRIHSPVNLALLALTAKAVESRVQRLAWLRVAISNVLRSGNAAQPHSLRRVRRRAGSALVSRRRGRCHARPSTRSLWGVHTPLAGSRRCRPPVGTSLGVGWSLLLREIVAMNVLMSHVREELVIFDMVDALRRG